LIKEHIVNGQKIFIGFGLMSGVWKKGNFDSLEKENFDSLESEILLQKELYIFS
jgi:hypothetical protein